MKDSLTGRIFDIKPFAVHDGPGIRTTVFFKGCSLRCRWCHNPESISGRPEMAFFPQRCVACGLCVAACPKGAQRLRVDGSRGHVRSLCTACGRCAEVCYAEAMVKYGHDVTVDEVMEEILQDAPFYEASGGGVTVSGGEPLLQAPFVAELLKVCRAEGIHTAVDTCGQVPWTAFETVLPVTDLVLYDVKHIDGDRHKAATGAGNGLILENLVRLSGRGVPVEVRVPVVPGVNDDRGTIEGIAAFLPGLKDITGVRLLPYHDLSGSKYRSIGRERGPLEAAVPHPGDLRRIAGWMEPFGLPVRFAGDGGVHAAGQESRKGAAS